MDPASQAKRLHVPTYEEVLRRIKTRYPHNVGTFERERLSLELTRNVVISKTEPVVELWRLVRGLHPFYARLLETAFDLKQIEEDFRCVMKARRVAEEMWGKYRYVLLGAETEAEARRIGREGRGRMLSQLKKCSRSLERLKEVAKFLSGLPAIDTSLPIVIVAGPPNAGKSTFVATVSSAKPEIAPYPFTTKNVIIGHVQLGDAVVQVVDTPGLLDRDPAEMNEVERRAVAALRELPGPVVFLVDPTPLAALSVQEQLRLLDRVRGWLGERPVLVAINKVDAAGEDAIRSVEGAVRAKELKVVRLVAYKKELAMEVLRSALEGLRSSP